MNGVISQSNYTYRFKKNRPIRPQELSYAGHTPSQRDCGHREMSKNTKKSVNRGSRSGDTSLLSPLDRKNCVFYHKFSIGADFKAFQ